MAAVGVDLDQARHRTLLGGGIGGKRARRRGHARLAGTLHDAGLHGGMDLFGSGAVTQFQTVLRMVKVVAPGGLDALGIGEELLIKSFDVRSVAARQRRGSQQLAKACGHTRKNPVDSRSWSDKGAVC